MANYEVSEPILNSPYEEPSAHWHIEEDKVPEKREGRRAAGYYWYRDPKAPVADTEHEARGVWQPLEQVNQIRDGIQKWRAAGYPGASRTTIDLLNYWQREGREHRLFFAQLEAAETIIFLTEARADFRQGISIPLDEPSDEQKRNGLKAFTRYALKMATGTGKTTVMAMLAAWSILNKVNGKSDSRFSDTVLVVCPNVAIRNRLPELDPDRGDASLYRTGDLVPPELIPDLSRGKLIVTNWHVFEPQVPNVGGTGARVIKTGERVAQEETITIGPKKTVGSNDQGVSSPRNASTMRSMTARPVRRAAAVGGKSLTSHLRIRGHSRSGRATTRACPKRGNRRGASGVSRGARK